jgi:acyl carrier protein
VGEQSAEEALAVFRDIVARELEIRREIALNDRLVEDLELDSLGMTVVAVGLENRFRIRLSEEDAVRLVTVEDLVRLVAVRRAEALG